MADRPLLVAIISLLTMLAGILFILSGALFAFAGIEIDGLDIGSITDFVGIGLLIMGLIVFIIGYAIWSGWTIAWYVAVILYIISAIMSIISLVSAITGGGSVGFAMIVPLVITILILYYLFRPKVKEFFKV